MNDTSTEYGLDVPIPSHPIPSHLIHAHHTAPSSPPVTNQCVHSTTYLRPIDGIEDGFVDSIATSSQRIGQEDLPERLLSHVHELLFGPIDGPVHIFAMHVTEQAAAEFDRQLRVANRGRLLVFVEQICDESVVILSRRGQEESQNYSRAKS